MSIELMSRIWRQDVRPAGKKLVLMAFADAANPDGLTWIAIESQRGAMDIVQKSSMDVRSVRRHVADLEAEGWLERWETVGKGCVWRVHSTPDNLSRPLTNCQGTPDILSPSPDILSGEPFLNRQEKEKEGERLKPIDGRDPITGRPLCPGVTLAQWEAFLDMRLSINKEVRPFVANKILSALEGFHAAGWHAGDILDRSTVNVWPDVYEPEQGRVTGVRRVVAGHVAEPVGMSDDDRRELARIANIEDVGEMLRQRREFMAALDRRNAPTPLSQMVGELPLRPPLRGKRS